MFFAEERIKAVREMILAEELEGRKKALAKILPYQKSDFYELMKTLEGMPVTIRFLDPPLHEFLPQEEVTSFFYSHYYKRSFNRSVRTFMSYLKNSMSS